MPPLRRCSWVKRQVRGARGVAVSDIVMLLSAELPVPSSATRRAESSRSRRHDTGGIGVTRVLLPLWRVTSEGWVAEGCSRLSQVQLVARLPSGYQLWLLAHCG